MSTVFARAGSSQATKRDVRVLPATAGDHCAIHHFLRQTVQRPSDDEFTAQLDRPGYQPSDRLLVVEDRQIVSHLLCARRTICYGEAALPTWELSDLVTAPHCRGRGYATALLRTAMSEMERAGALLGSLRTDIPAFYQRRGWTLGPRHCWSTAPPRDVLSLLSASDEAGPRLQVRVWRHVEQAALLRLHEAACRAGFGMCLRDDEQWRWLLGRGGCDRIYVALADNSAEADPVASMVALAVVSRGRILELAAGSDQLAARRELLRRVCADAMEAGDLEVRLDAAPGEPLHEVLEQAGGRAYRVEAERGLVNMVRVTSLPSLLESLAPLLWRRALQAGLSRPSELGLSCEAHDRVSKLRVVLTKGSVQIAEGKVGRSYLQGAANDLLQLVLGRTGLDELIAQGRLTPSTHTAHELAAALFPELPLFRSHLDDLPAAGA